MSTEFTILINERAMASTATGKQIEIPIKNILLVLMTI